MKINDIKLPSNRKFGFLFSTIFLVFSAYFFKYTSFKISYTFFVLAVVFLLITLAKPNLLLPLNKLWMRFGFILGMIISPIVIGFIFFFLFTPISQLMKLLGRDELRLKFSDKKSYWKERSADNVQTDTFKRQF